MATADDIPDGIPDFGSSSEVCDELRHSIRQEVSDIDASITKIEEESGKETRASQELVKCLSYAHKEMFNLSRGAGDLVDSTNMNESLRRRMMNDLQGELVAPYLLKGKQKNLQIDETNDESRGDGGIPSPSSVAFLEERQQEIKLFETNKSKLHALVVELMDEKRRLVEDTLSIENLMESEKLVDKVQSTNDDVKSLSEDLEKEKRRLRITKEAVHDARTKSGMHAQEIADFTKILTTKKANHEAERKKLEEILAEEEAKLSLLEKDDSLEKKTREKAHQLEIITKQIAEAEDARKRRAEIMERRSLVEKETASLREALEKTEEELATKRQEKASALSELEEAKSLAEQAAAQKAHNDRVESEKIIPGQTTRSKLQKEKDTLVQKHAEIHAKSDTVLKELAERNQEVEAQLDKLKLEVKTVTDKNEGVTTELAHIKLARDELRDSTEKECAENRKIASNFTEAYNAEKTRKLELEEALEKNRKTKLEEARVETARQRQEKEELLEVMQRGAEMLEEVRDLEVEVERLQADRYQDD